MAKFVGKVYRSAYSYDTKVASDACSMRVFGPSLTVQSQKDDADINVIVKRFGLTGVMPVHHRVPEYGDFSHVTDYRSALDAVEAAAAHFMEMPAEVRARFGNDPQFFMEYCSNPQNLAQMCEMGLAVKREVTDNKGTVKFTVNPEGSTNGGVPAGQGVPSSGPAPGAAGPAK